MGKKAKGSRKGKKAWRANISSADIEDFYEKSTKDALSGGSLSSAPSDSLFFVDKSTGIYFLFFYFLMFQFDISTLWGLIWLNLNVITLSWYCPFVQIGRNEYMWPSLTSLGLRLGYCCCFFCCIAHLCQCVDFFCVQ